MATSKPPVRQKSTGSAYLSAAVPLGKPGVTSVEKMEEHMAKACKGAIQLQINIHKNNYSKSSWDVEEYTLTIISGYIRADFKLIEKEAVFTKRLADFRKYKESAEARKRVAREKSREKDLATIRKLAEKHNLKLNESEVSPVPKWSFASDTSSS